MFWHDLPTRLALIGLALTVLYMLVMGRWMATHYTRVPGGKWTTWEKAVAETPKREEKRAA